MPCCVVPCCAARGALSSPAIREKYHGEERERRCEKIYTEVCVEMCVYVDTGRGEGLGLGAPHQGFSAELQIHHDTLLNYGPRCPSVPPLTRVGGGGGREICKAATFHGDSER
ncbi:hypothetical protein E2C01_069291 [Portunus trituberculatus]|uniref:Uncharacterized protein n=1 Tax=Portunus trituberculatus TaxID=210409 RepID=A0A5B7HR22_PORTR|nr:hypothetical protein [Portunus trituberculatus]